MARKPNTEARRAEIVTALQAVMARQGYEKATILAIAKEAGLAPGLLHYHFKSKQEILVCLVETLAAFGASRFAQIAGEGGTPHERLRAYISARLGLGQGAAPEMVAAWVMIGAESVRQAEVREVFQRAIARELEQLEELLAACLQERGTEREVVRKLAAAILALMEGAFQLACATDGVMPSGYAAEAALQFAEQGMRDIGR